jgi:hypothetical protein
MPICEICRKSEYRKGLVFIEGRGIICKSCSQSLPDTNENADRLFSLTVYERPSPDGGKDHEFNLIINTEDLNFMYFTTLSKLKSLVKKMNWHKDNRGTKIK